VPLVEPARTHRETQAMHDAFRLKRDFMLERLNLKRMGVILTVEGVRSSAHRG
jgi:hypothetical protein